MKLKPARLAPFLIAIIAIAAVCLVRVLSPELTDRLERITYDSRVAASQRFPQPAATNLGAVFISDDSIKALNNGSLGFSYGVRWPRHIYGRVLQELSAQGAASVAFDILYGELRPEDAPVPVAGERGTQAAVFFKSLYPGQEPPTFTDQGEELTLLDSDDYFAWQIRNARMAILAAETGVLPHPLFATNAIAMGDISAQRDPDGVLRRAQAFRLYRHWHPAFTQVETNRDYGVDLSKVEVAADRIILRTNSAEPIVIRVDADNQFELADFGGDDLPPGTAPKAVAFVDERVWHMGIVLAARALELDLEHPQIDLKGGTITLRGTNGVSRTIPVDAEARFYINWELKALDPRLQKEPVEKLLLENQRRAAGQPPVPDGRWRNKLVIIGSSATGNDLTDMGTTPLGKDTLLVSKHWNVANSIISGRFVRRVPLGMELFMIALLGGLAAWLTLRLSPLHATLSVLLVSAAYVGFGFLAYISHRNWVPIVYPVLGGLVLTHGALVTWRLMFEQTERRRVKSVFSKIVSPEVVNELLGAEKLSLGGARRMVTVLFADVRGFTELTDTAQDQATEYVQRHNLTGDEAEAHLNEVAHETLNTVNLYLSIVADRVKQYDGTLDKYIGDCVMAFWGAPIPNSSHALACVRAAIDAQRAISEMNLQRAEESRQREIENVARLSTGMRPRQLLPVLSLGTGINTGPVTVGLMGSEAHILNYTVFGREVNVAARLEHESGRGRIVISEATFEQLQRDDATLAARCIPLEPVTVKGIRTAVKIYEVPWKDTKKSPEEKSQQP